MDVRQQSRGGPGGVPPCTAAALSIGAVGCAAIGGAVGGAVEAVGLGALGGALGAGLAGPLGGRLVSEALDGVLPQAATQGLVGAGSGAVSGGVTALARCGMNCGRDCSVSGALSAAGAGALAGGVGGAAFGALGGLRARGRSSAEEPVACPIHSFTASTKVLLADGSSKPIFSLKVGDRVANSQPGKAEVEAHPVDRVIVTETDHDFVDLKVKPSRIRRAVGRAAAGLAVAAAVVTGGAVPASAAPATVTTTYHHPFYDVTRGEFVEAVNLQVGDRLQSVDGGEATVEEVTPYHSTEVTYDLTIDELHTYYVFAGDVPVLVHNCGNSAAHDAQNIAENLDDNVYFHYTSEGGHAGIVAPGGGLRIGANAGKVHVTQEMGSPAEVEQNIFIGNPKYSGKADFLVAFRMSEGVELRPGSQPNEMIFDGSLKVPARNVIYHGRNPF